MRTAYRAAVACTLAACVAGCGSLPPTTPSAVVTPARKKIIEPVKAQNVIEIGRSTKAQLIAALGETLVISFDSGYEVWVYRIAGTPTAEFVVLFAPSGVVAKTRVRRAHPAGRDAV